MAEDSAEIASPPEPAAASKPPYRCALLEIVIRSDEAGLWHAESPDMPPLNITEKTPEDALRQIPVVLEAFGDIDGLPVAAFRTDHEGFWVIIPRDDLRSALNAPAGSTVPSSASPSSVI